MARKKVPLSVSHPELAAMAHGWDPSQYSAGMNIKVEWKCDLGHITQSLITTRVVTQFCTICSGRHVLKGFNDLATKFPDIASEADGWDPTTVTPGSGQKRDWLCPSGHSYSAKVANRVSLNSGCPYCSGRHVLKGFNDLATKFPDIASEADGWDPTTVTFGSGTRVQWKCANDHQWIATVNARTSSSSGCAICGGKQVLRGFNDLATTHPELAAEADGWDPTTVIAGSHQKLKWTCADGHSWLTSVKSRSRGSNCPICSGNQTLSGFNDLATTHPELAAEADGWDPTTVIAGNGVKRNWVCSAGHRWKATIASRKRGSGCPVCSGKLIVAGINDLATTHPNLALEAHKWNPSCASKGQHQVVEWRCPKKHIFSASIYSRTVSGNGCPVCSGRQILIGYNDLATTHPELAAEADGWDPTTVSFGSQKRVSWIGSCGHRWTVRVATRASQKRNCPICTSKQILIGYNDLATTHPELAAEADGWDPTTVTYASGKRVQWKCSLGHNWITTVASRGHSKNTCPICSGQQVLSGFNDLATRFPDIAREAHGWDPTLLTSGSGQKLPWICSEKHLWRATVSSRTGPDKTGCPSCAKYGFDPNKPGWIYFLRHDNWGYFQIGITNKLEDRISDHRRKGFELIEVRGPMKGYLAKDIETAMLRTLNKRGAIFANKIHKLEFSGWSETWTEASLSISNIGQLMDWVYEDDN
jgi:hypothetical protein